MQSRKLIALVLSLILLDDICAEVNVEETERAFLQKCEVLAASIGTKQRSHEAVDNWYFFKDELRHIGIGEFWGESSASVSKSNNVDYSDPLPAIIAFNEDLRDRGIRLIFVPVPAKAMVYPDSIDWELKKDETVPRLDPYHRAFYDILHSNSVHYIDLLQSFLHRRNTMDTLLYCRSDTHWSGEGIKIAAGEIARIIKDESWYSDVRKMPYSTQSQTITLGGDLLPAGDDFTERISIDVVKDENTGELVEVWEDSPVLLIGDSHTLVFHSGGDLYAEGSGLADHLARELGFPVDLIGVRGSGSTTSRVNLYRKMKRNSEYLEKKKVIVWCLSVREFSESPQGWRLIPFD